MTKSKRNFKKRSKRSDKNEKQTNKRKANDQRKNRNNKKAKTKKAQRQSVKRDKNRNRKSKQRRQRRAMLWILQYVILSQFICALPLPLPLSLLICSLSLSSSVSFHRSFFILRTVSFFLSLSPPNCCFISIVFSPIFIFSLQNLQFSTFDFTDGKPVPAYLGKAAKQQQLKKKPSKEQLLKQVKAEQQLLQQVKNTEVGQVHNKV